MSDDMELVEFCANCGMPKPWHPEFGAAQTDAEWGCQTFTPFVDDTPNDVTGPVEGH